MKRTISLIMAVLTCWGLLLMPAQAAEAPCAHEYETTVIPATCTRDGYTIYICPKCGEKFTADEVPALGHDFVEGICTRCEAREYYPAVIRVDLQKQLDLMDVDARVGVGIDLKELDWEFVLSEIAREMGVDLETLKQDNQSEYTMAYVTAKRTVLKRLYGEYNRSFLATYLPDLPADCRCYVADTHASFWLSLTKAEIMRLADAEQVFAMEYISPEEMDAVASNDAASLVVPFRFDDVKDDTQFYYAPVYWAVEQKITKGTSGKLFSPNDSCTRAQVVTFLWRAAGEPEPAETVNPFQDVKADAYYYKAVLWAVEKGITKGTSAGAFSPEATCTRAQIVTFLYRADGAPEVSRKSKPFADVADGQYYADAVAWAVESGVTTGKSPDTFAPNATCTRAEVVTFLYRASASE
ncbi:MAG: S-layer homology domain-containing protein [Oscillospiraceae bacterium]|nr:S-layer homology domain-containing protein [Oscillospiraceae bacterium]